MSDIRNRYTGEVMFSGECTLADLAQANRANLSGASLSGANLYRASLYGANLSGANLSRASLPGANLSGASLYGSDLYRASLSGSDLSETKINWQSHDLLAEILKRAAGADIQKRSLAGLILISRDWCWKEFLSLDHTEREWALGELAKWVQDGDRHPEILDQYRAEGGSK